jgi:hypothetical protein
MGNFARLGLLSSFIFPAGIIPSGCCSVPSSVHTAYPWDYSAFFQNQKKNFLSY